MTVANTSINAYKEHRASGKLGNQAREIFNAMQFNVTYSRRELVKLTGLELSSVCGRVNELVSSGLLMEMPSRKCMVTGKTVKPVAKSQLI